MLKQLWRTNAPLTFTGLLMLPALAISIVGAEHGDLRIPHFTRPACAAGTSPDCLHDEAPPAKQRYTSPSDVDCGRKLLHIGRAAAHTGAPGAADSKARRAHIRAIRRMGPRHGDLGLEVR